MKKALIVFLVLAVAGGLFAQVMMPSAQDADGNPISPANPWGGLSQPSNLASGGRYNAASNPTGTGGWGYTFDNWIGYIGFNRPGGSEATDGVQLAYGTRLNDIYLGFYYGGSGFRNVFTHTYSESNFYSTQWKHNSTVATEARPFRVYDSINLAGPAPQNRFGVALGLESMGFNLIYATTFQGFNEDDVMIGDPGDGTTVGDFYQNITAGYGQRYLEIGWGLMGNLLPDGISPSATIRMRFVRNFWNQLEYPAVTARENDDIEIMRSMNYFEPEVEVNTGNYTLLRSNGWTLNGQLRYILTLRMYNNEFNYRDATGVRQVGEISGFGYGVDAAVPGDDEGIEVGVEMSYSQHRIRPQISVARTIGDVAVTAIVNTEFTFRSETGETMATNFNVNGVPQYGDLRATDLITVNTFQISPQIDVGLRWRAIANRLDLYTGSIIRLGIFERVTTETEVFEYNAAGARVPNTANVPPNNDTIVTSSSASYDVAANTATFRFGGTFWFNPNIGLDMLSNVSRATGFNLLDDVLTIMRVSAILRF